MKQWRVDNYIIGPAVDAEYDDTADKLAEVLNSYERKGYTIKEVIEVREGFFRIIYTSEDDYEDENICASYRVRKVKTHLSDYEQGVYFGRYGVHNEYIEKDEPYCMGTRELESCNCDGDRSKCTFYKSADKDYEKEREVIKSRKETAKEILHAVDDESNGQTISVTNVLRKKYGVEVEE